MDTKSLGKWVYIGGLLVAVVAALVEFTADWLALLLMIAGILAGLFYSDPAEVEKFVMRYLGLAAVAAVLNDFVAIGPYITTIMMTTVAFLGPVLLTTLVVWFYNKSFGK